MLVCLATFVRGGVIVVGSVDGELRGLARVKLPAAALVLLASPVYSQWSTLEPTIAFDNACSFSMLEANGDCSRMRLSCNSQAARSNFGATGYELSTEAVRRVSVLSSEQRTMAATGATSPR